MLMISRHVDAISKNPRVDIEAVRKITYLHEFDRYVLATLQKSVR